MNSTATHVITGSTMRLEVTSRPVRPGHQHAPEVTVRDSGAEILSLSPDHARDLAAALNAAADRADD